MWNGMIEDVVEYVNIIKQNNYLQRAQDESFTDSGPLPTTTAGYTYVLTFTDYYTKFVDFYPLKDKTAGGVAHGIKPLFAVCFNAFLFLSTRWGAPCRLLSDQGREFVAKVNTQICKQLGISRSVTSAYHPQTNGLDERTNQTLKVRLAKRINEHQHDWDDYLEEIPFSIRTQKQGSTKYSPFFLMFGRHVRTPMEMEDPSDGGDIKPEDPSAEEFEEIVAERADLMKNVGKKVEENVEKVQAKQKEEYAKTENKGVKVFNLSVGEVVLRKCMKNSGQKGGKIAEIDNHQRIQLAHIKSGEMLKVNVAYDQIRPHVTSDLHKPVVPEVSINPDPSSCTDITHNDVPSNQSAVPCPIKDSLDSLTSAVKSLKGR
ncbi:Gypsy retrotransposon integrase 1 [Paramuricea clavata]|uniref:Gypsy retrotransposon integrase 1 n=1 Tax=Paramuricea clavata TaxID=317549 RepID=A0A7D9DQ29_PARCT|nr:Gypsy retrotransposon integrase 1 [Paramuricea clavata]